MGKVYVEKSFESLKKKLRMVGNERERRCWQFIFNKKNSITHRLKIQEHYFITKLSH
jgi:hypothetical protein